MDALLCNLQWQISPTCTSTVVHLHTLHIPYWIKIPPNSKNPKLDRHKWEFTIDASSLNRSSSVDLSSMILFGNKARQTIVRDERRICILVQLCMRHLETVNLQMGVTYEVGKFLYMILLSRTKILKYNLKIINFEIHDFFSE